MERVLILGASRGLGAALVRHLAQREVAVVGVGRKVQALASLRDQFPLFSYLVADLSTHMGQDEVLRHVLESGYSKIFYVAGGGPYGLFHERGWKDHLWSWEVSFLAPARLLHALRVANRGEQVVVIGSSVAESAPDPLAASYCAAKSALRGLVLSLRAENVAWDVRLFSPGYMDTEMLPANAPARKNGVYEPGQIAHELWIWSLSADNSGHKLYPKHPS